jgi:hypothetical protein
VLYIAWWQTRMVLVLLSIGRLGSLTCKNGIKFVNAHTNTNRKLLAALDEQYLAHTTFMMHLKFN